MAQEKDQILTELAETTESYLEELAWVKQGVRDERGFRKVVKSRKGLAKAVDAYAKFSEQIETLDFDDEDNEKWFAKWRELKAEVSEIEARMEQTMAKLGGDDEDAFASDDDNDNPNEQGIAASLQMADDIKRTIDSDIDRLVRILDMTEEMKDMANRCLEELEIQREKLMRINDMLKAIDKNVERAETVLDKIKINMVANKMCWAVGCTVIWLLVCGVIAVGVVCAPDGPVNACGGAVDTLNDFADAFESTNAPVDGTASDTARSRRFLRGLMQALLE